MSEDCDEKTNDLIRTKKPAQLPLVSLKIKKNVKRCSAELQNSFWKNLSENENGCKRCITRAAKYQFSLKRARKSTISHIFPCDVGIKAFLRMVKTLLQRKIIENFF